MQNEKDCFGHCNVFEHNHDFVIVFQKSDDANIGVWSFR